MLSKGIVVVKPINLHLLHVNPVITKHSKSLNIWRQLLPPKPALSLLIEM
jgi:hypothetical protein